MTINNKQKPPFLAYKTPAIYKVLDRLFYGYSLYIATTQQIFDYLVNSRVYRAIYKADS